MAILSETSKTLSDVQEVKTYKLINDGAAAASSTAVDSQEFTSVTLLVESSAGVSGGVVQLECAMTSSYAGTWKSLGSLTINAASTTFTVSSTALPVPYIRARISTLISNGTVDVYLIVRR